MKVPLIFAPIPGSFNLAPRPHVVSEQTYNQTDGHQVNFQVLTVLTLFANIFVVSNA